MVCSVSSGSSRDSRDDGKTSKYHRGELRCLQARELGEGDVPRPNRDPIYRPTTSGRSATYRHESRRICDERIPTNHRMFDRDLITLKKIEIPLSLSIRSLTKSYDFPR